MSMAGLNTTNDATCMNGYASCAVVITHMYVLLRGKEQKRHMHMCGIAKSSCVLARLVACGMWNSL
jgi:hypothetical protein